MDLRETVSKHWRRLQEGLFPMMEEELGPLPEKHRVLAIILETLRIEIYLPYLHGVVGRPRCERAALFRAFVAKSVFNLSTTRVLIDLLECDARLRRLCGWERRKDIPSESTFSRAFADFAEQRLPERMHATLIKAMLGSEIIGHVSRDGTAIEAREKPIAKPKIEKPAPKKRGRPRRGEEPPPKDPTRIERQQSMSLAEILDDLPKPCDVGAKRNAKGHQESWIGYKFHIDTIDGDIPVSCILTSASVHDSQVAIPLAMMTSARVYNLYDLMDSAYDDPGIRAFLTGLGHVPLIDVNPRRNAALKAEMKREANARRTLRFMTPEDRRYKQRSSAERVNSQLKDNYGGRQVRVRGNTKVFAHLMFGMLSLTAIQLVRLVI